MAVAVSRGALATASNDDATSKLYVDTTVATRQDAVDANTTNTVMTYTDTVGTVGAKNIYDSTGSYAEQQDALVSADVANTAIMNAINMEFTCAEYNPNDATDCWKWSINIEAINHCANGFSENGFKYVSYSTIPNVNGNFLDNYIVETYRTLTYENGTAICSWLSVEGTANNGYLGVANGLSFIAGHKYASIAYVNVTQGAQYNIGLSALTGTITGGESENQLTGTGNWEWAVMPISCVSGGTARLNYRIQTRGATMQVKQMYFVDLTEIFGAGNEPINANEILSACVVPCSDTYMPQNQ